MGGEMNILVVDENPAARLFLREMLPEEEGDWNVEVVKREQVMLDRLAQRSYDVVVADFRRFGFSGSDLVKRVKSFGSSTRVLIMTAYDYEEMGLEDRRRFFVYKYITGPLGEGRPTRIVQQKWAEMAVSKKGLLILSDERLASITKRLGDLRLDIGAQQIILADIVGDLITYVGDIRKLDTDTFIPVVAIGLASSFELSSYFQEKWLGFNLNYHEGERYAVYSANVGTELFLTFVFDQRVRTSKVGTVWYYSKRVIEELLLMIGSQEEEQSASEETGHDLAVGVADLAAAEPEQVLVPELQPVETPPYQPEPAAPLGQEPAGVGKGQLLDFSGFGLEQAIAQGLIDPAVMGLSSAIGAPGEEEGLDLGLEGADLLDGESQPAGEASDDGLFTGFGIEEAIKRGLIDPKVLGVMEQQRDQNRS